MGLFIERRINCDDIAVITYYKRVGGPMVYRYADDMNPWMYDERDTPIRRFDDIAAFESFAASHLN